MMNEAQSQGVIDRLKRPLVSRQDAEERTFHLGLVLSGTVSAGAWTAGVLDLLFETLDAWQAAKDAGRDVPDHNVRIDVVGGASGGGVCAALLARAATCRFPAVRDAAGATEANPFWQIWVEALDIGGMLGSTDLAAEDALAASLMDGRAIDEAVQGLLEWRPGAFPQVQALAQPRRWLADPFRVLLTLTNLRGVPYRMRLARAADGTERFAHRVDHADHVIFAVPTTSRGAAPADLRGDEFVVGPALTAGRADWARLGNYAKATAAFPIGFPARRLERPKAHYDWRAVLSPAVIRGGVMVSEPKVLLRRPDWTALPNSIESPDYVFDCVDGGALNNQPIDLVRAALAGLGESMPRGGDEARAAVLLIEPLAAAVECIPPTSRPHVLSVAGDLIGAWTAQSRHSTANLALALDAEVYSRFMLTAGRQDAATNKMRWGEDALATAGLSGFLGFFQREWRVHDYLLGRRNCEAYLRHHFTLPATNGIFGAFANSDTAKEFAGRSGPGEATQLQIIPVLAEVTHQGPGPSWPLGASLPEGLDAAIRRRVRDFGGLSLSGFGVDGLLSNLMTRFVSGRVAPQAVRAVQEAVEDRGL